MIGAAPFAMYSRPTSGVSYLLAGFVAFELKVMPSGSVEANRRVAQDDIRLTGKRLVERARVEAILYTYLKLIRCAEDRYVQL